MPRLLKSIILVTRVGGLKLCLCFYEFKWKKNRNRFVNIGNDTSRFRVSVAYCRVVKVQD